MGKGNAHVRNHTLQNAHPVLHCTNPVLLTAPTPSPCYLWYFCPTLSRSYTQELFLGLPALMRFHPKHQPKGCTPQLGQCMSCLSRALATGKSIQNCQGTWRCCSEGCRNCATVMKPNQAPEGLPWHCQELVCSPGGQCGQPSCL